MLDNKKTLFGCFRAILLSLLMIIGVLSIQVGFAFANADQDLIISAQPTIVDDVCALIYKGQFDEARQLLKQNSSNPDTKSDLLSDIIEKYEAINKGRCQNYAKSYQEQIEKLEEFQVGSFDVNDPNYIFDPNNVHKVLAVINKACEYADPEQKKAVLERPFVKRTFEKVINIASEYEAQGKWLEAYTVCYYWLVVIDEDNKSYDDYAEKLLEKANIVASFQDSPCETSKERYKGVNKKVFIKAINALNFNYVKPVDYHKMAVKAIKRCELLTEVLQVSPELAESVSAEKSFTPGSEHEILHEYPNSKIVKSPSFIPPDSNLLSVWLNSLLSVESEIEQFPIINKEKFIDIFEKVLALNSTTAKLPKEILISQFAEASLSSLDPHTVIVWPRQVQDFDKIMTNAFTGIGVEISRQKGQLTISSLLPDTPAYKSGLDAQDVIVKVDGVETKDMSLICAVKNITGPKGTPVTLTIKRAGEVENFDITIVRDRIVVATIRGWQRKQTGGWRYFIDEINKIGYIRITGFTEKTANDFETVLNQLENQGLKGMILDLRFNGGGLLTSAVEIVDMFVSDGLIVRTQPRFGIPSRAYAHSRNTHRDYPMAILVNSSSASASEIVSGALQDEKHKRAIVVGTRTYGKGSVQGITQYSNGGMAQLKYTMAYYHLPSGQRVESKQEVEEKGREDWGITPDVKVELKSNELKAMFDARRDNDVLVKEGHNNKDIPVKKHLIKDVLDADSQLAIGVLVIKSKLIQSGNYIAVSKQGK